MRHLTYYMYKDKDKNNFLRELFNNFRNAKTYKDTKNARQRIVFINMEELETLVLV